ncbi:hypothetical protein J2T17_001097 [Paenibacillus mucilaginosus]
MPREAEAGLKRYSASAHGRRRPVSGRNGAAAGEACIYTRG